MMAKRNRPLHNSMTMKIILLPNEKWLLLFSSVCVCAKDACVRKMYIHHISASEKRNRYFVSIDHFFSRVIGEMVIFFFCFFSWVRAAERRWLLFAHFSGPTMWREINNICTVCCVLFVCKTFSLWNHTPWFGRPISHTFCWYICWNENCSLIRQQATTSTRTSFNFHKFECV